MATMPELITKLAERQKVAFQAEQEAKVPVREAEREVQKLCEEVMELKRGQEHEILDLKAQYDKRYRDYSYNCRQKVQEAQKLVITVEAQADRAETRRQRAEANAAALALKLEDLQEQAAKRKAAQDEHISSLHRVMDARLERVAEQADRRSQDVSDFAEAVSEQSAAAIDTMAAELQEQLAKRHLKAEERVRFKELCGLAKSCGDYDMSKPAYYIMKNELLTLWQQQKSAASSSSPRSLGISSTLGLPSPKDSLRTTSRAPMSALCFAGQSSLGSPSGVEAEAPSTLSARA
eukprot:CAMPEP_0170582750 /NCGR_PEP_ID=MMETSP0224-20130122/7753_1 /TAXON_ID=285029 /ORGANISM="Togula jolla, Strain CCCM 725" /LENGTH=291 /DNA_ID=CAMNT_0010906001 /DNA_START=63 /DNA_END=938 /DNA_ORIENTATION=-